MIDLRYKYSQLLQLLTDYLLDRRSCNDLLQFAWDIIDCFTDTPEEKLPGKEDFEKEFWFAIWQIQHLCDAEHETDCVAKRELKKALAYMKGDIKIPTEYSGERPK